MCSSEQTLLTSVMRFGLSNGRCVRADQSWGADSSQIINQESPHWSVARSGCKYSILLIPAVLSQALYNLVESHR